MYKQNKIVAKYTPKTHQIAPFFKNFFGGHAPKPQYPNPSSETPLF